MSYQTPSNLKDALAFLERPGCKIIAGCTDFFPSQTEGETHDCLLDVTRVAELRGISETADGWRFGASVTWTEIAKAVLPPMFDGLKLAALEVGSIQIQNRGTVAGNLCNASPAADGVPPLLTLDARVEIASSQGLRNVALEDFITGVRRVDLGPGELVSGILIPKMSGTAQGTFLKLGSRKHLVISIAMVAAVVELRSEKIAGARLSVGSCSAVAQRLPGLEARLAGLPVADLSAEMFSERTDYDVLSPISDVRGTADYRHDVAAEMCHRAVQDAIRKGAQR